MKRVLFLLFFAIIYLLPFSASAEAVENVRPPDAKSSSVDTAPAELVMLEPVVVTAARRKTSLKEAPARVTVINRREIEKFQEPTVDNILRNIPDISAKRTFVAECGPGRELTLRGIPDQKRTLVLVDGIPVNDGFNGAVNWSMIQKDSIDRLEIVRGPMSSLYGSGAMGGVINIITAMPKKKGETIFRNGYGNYNTYTSSIYSSCRSNEKNAYLVGGRFFHTDGYMKVLDQKAYHVKNDRDDWNLQGKYQYSPTDNSRLTLGVNSVKEKYNRGRLFDYQQNEMKNVYLTYDRLGKADLTMSVFGNNNFRDVAVGAAPTNMLLEHTEKDDISRYGFISKASFSTGGHLITAGIDSAYNKFDKINEFFSYVRTGKAEGKQLLNSFFIQDETVLLNKDGKKLTLTYGGRSEHYKNYAGSMFDTRVAPIARSFEAKSWKSFNPRAGLVYNPDADTTLRLSAGKAFAAPMLSDLYMVFSRGPIVFNGNPDLKPESAVSYDFGVDRRISNNVTGRFDAYYARGKDFIGNRLIAANTYQSDNISEIKTTGFDVELRYNGFNRLAPYIGYTHNLSKIERDANRPLNAGNYLNDEPVHKGNFGVRYEKPRDFSVDLNASYVGKRFTDIENKDVLDAYLSLNLYIAKKMGKNRTFSIGAENLSNNRYKVYSLPTDVSYAPGTLFNAFLTMNF